LRDGLDGGDETVFGETAVDGGEEAVGASGEGPADAGLVIGIGGFSFGEVSRTGESGNLSDGMDTRVGARGAEEFDGLADDLADGTLQDVLDGAEGDSAGTVREEFEGLAPEANVAGVGGGRGGVVMMAADGVIESPGGEWFLLLPAAEIGTFVGDGEFVAGQGERSRWPMERR
jgi:hypothetical protein